MVFLTKQWQRFTADWHVLLEQPVLKKELSLMLVQSSLPSFGFYLMLTLATIIATLGLLSNSAATIIGAMIVAPLMGPIVSLAYGITTADYKLTERSIITVATGIVVVVAIAAITAHSIGLRVVGGEILARTNPTLLDLGVAVAAGAAGSFAMTRKSIANALAGVAIAVALVPPLCVTGIGIGLSPDVAAAAGLTLSDVGIVAGSFLLFATNLVGIVVSAGTVFLLHSYGSLKQAIVGLMAAILSLLFVSYPLGFSFKRLLVRNEVYHSLAEIKKQRSDLFSEVDSYSWNVQFVKEEVFVEMDLMAPIGTMSREKLGLMESAIAQSVNAPVSVKFRLIPIEIVNLSTDPETSKLPR